MTQAQHNTTEAKTGTFRRAGTAIKTFFGKLLEKPPQVKAVALHFMIGEWDGKGSYNYLKVTRTRNNSALGGFTASLYEVNPKTNYVTLVFLYGLESFAITTIPGELFEFGFSNGIKFTARISMKDPLLTRVHPMLEAIGFPGNNSEKHPEVQAVGLNYRFGVWDGKGDSNYVRVFKESGSSLTLFLAKFNGVDPNTGKVAIEIHGIEYNVLPGEPFTFTFSVIRNQKCTGIVSLG